MIHYVYLAGLLPGQWRTQGLFKGGVLHWMQAVLWYRASPGGGGGGGLRHFFLKKSWVSFPGGDIVPNQLLHFLLYPHYLKSCSLIGLHSVTWPNITLLWCWWCCRWKKSAMPWLHWWNNALFHQCRHRYAIDQWFFIDSVWKVLSVSAS